MALSPGTRLGSYEILEPLGAGGMGEVYRSHDTKLGRDVAVKILPGEVGKDPERLQRFEREAHLLASLNHPNIAAIYGLEDTGDQPFLVLELVEGEDLKVRLERGAIPVDEALEIAEQIAEALEEAHSKGIVHRDLKPANVKLTPDGKVKVLDFGLAKAWAGEVAEGASSSAALSQSPTLAHTGTAAGVILGTAAYMSPEQAQGKPVDKRGDVWAFGVLLWEMLTGRALFVGDTVTDIIAAVVTKEPDLDALPVDTPRVVRRLIAHCLRKDPRARLPDIGAARLDLQEVLAGTAPEVETPAGEPGETTRAERIRRTRERWGWAAVSLVAAGLAATLAFVHMTEVPEPRSVVRLVVDAPEGWSFQGFWPVPSPDGRHVVIWGGRDSSERGDWSTMLWLRSLESLTTRPLAATETAQTTSDPFWSPDSRFIGFFADGELRKLRLDDETIRRVCALPAPFTYNADWNQEGTIIFGALEGFGGTEPGGLYTVPTSGGKPKPLLMADLARGEHFLGDPQFLPDGRRFLFAAFGKASASESPPPLGVYVGSLDRPAERRLLMPEIAHLELTAKHALFNREGTLFAQPFGTEHVEFSGEPLAIASSVAFDRQNDAGMFGVSSGGTLAYLSGEEEDRFQLAWFDRQGQQVGTLGAPEAYRQIALSPDQRRVVVEIRDAEGQWDLWVIDTSRGVASRLTSDPADETNPVWSPDGREVAFAKYTTDGSVLFRKGLHRGASVAPLLEPPGYDVPEDWSRDGQTILYVSVDTFPVSESSLWALSLAGEGSPEPVAEQTGFWLDEPQLSPDGRWLAYISNESGAWEVYVEPFRRPGERVRVSVAGGGQPKWRGDAKELFYRKLAGTVMAVEVREEAGKLEVGLPTELFDAGEVGRAAHDSYAVSADGQRFLVKLPVGGDRKVQMHVVVNWESLLE